MTTSIFKDIPGYEGYYQVNNLGEIYSIGRFKKNGSKLNWMPGKILKPVCNGKYGHLFIRLCKKKFYIHRLVAQSFLGLDIKNTKILVCHKDDNPKNNTCENLFLGTCLDNIQDCVKKGRNATKFKTNHCFLKEEDILYIRNSVGILKQSVLANMFGTHQSHISKIQNNLARKYG